MAEGLFGKLTVVSVEELPDGQCKIVFDMDDQFKENFKKLYGLKRMSRKRFNDFVVEALKRGLDKEKISG